MNLVAAMLAGKVPVSIRTIGGLTTYNYPIDSVYAIEPIPLGASTSEIATALGSTNPPPPTKGLPGYVSPSLSIG